MEAVRLVEFNLKQVLTKLVTHLFGDGPFYQGLQSGRCHSTASTEPTQLTAAVASIVNTSCIILQYEQNLAKRQQHEDDCEEDMDTDIPESTGCGNWDIMVAVGLVDTVEC
ncbi:Phenylalanyl-tRNA synthetase [Chelonia mydas]|uniref:Phenylalanyl-tRNA synthetase n=1 Tax=Chelonia mydas TaxID=8469 RepID=M7B4B0_CHEMY|nr:Phenylalanyl-tRNA synthetase [Chelonia mydas]